MSVLLSRAPRKAKTRTHHAALNNQDILGIIFSNLQPADPTYSSREDLVQGRKQLRMLTIVCKTFRDPAVNCLWASLDSLLPLIKILPNLKVIDNAYYYNDSIDKRSKFRCYASKIRSLDLRSVGSGSASSPAISPHLYTLIAKELEGEALFPNLKRLFMNTSSNPNNDFMSLSLVLSAGLPSVGFSGDGLSSPFFTDHCFPLVARQLKSSLKRLSLKNIDRATSPSTLECIIQFANLEALDLQLPESSSVKPNVLLRLGRTLKKLSSLTLDLHFQSHRFTQQTSTEGTSEDPFPELKTSHAINRSGNQICECIPPFLRVKMTHLTMIVWGGISSVDFFKALAETLGSISTLKKLELTEAPGQILNVSYLTALDPLLRLPLVEFSVDISGINWGGDAIEPLINTAFSSTRSVPLRKLRLPWKAAGSQCASLSCLSFTAEKAAALEELSLGIRSTADSGGGFWSNRRFSSIPSLLSHWKIAPPSKSQLRYLAISEQKQLSGFNAEQYNDIAQLLDLMFPRLVSVKPFSEADRTAPYWKDHWWFIEHLRKMYKELRLLRTPNMR